MTHIAQQERRRSRRVRIGQPLMVRPTDPRDREFQETSTTKNVSRDGIYFVSRVGSYYEGMRLFVSVPHHSPPDPQDREYVGQVTRVEKLGEGEWGGCGTVFISAEGEVKSCERVQPIDGLF